jgi:hypothetical protein
MDQDTNPIRVYETDRKRAAKAFPGMTYKAIFAVLLAGYDKLSATDKVASLKSAGTGTTHRNRSRKVSIGA